MKYLLAAVLFLAGCARPKPLPVLGQVPDFELTAQDGSTFHSQDLGGKIWVADFIYTTCPGPCPLITRKMREIQSVRPEVRLLSFTVDPEHDTPPALAAYAASVHARPNWYFLTGKRDTLQMLSREAFKLADLGLIHSTRLVLVDGKAQIRGYYTEAPEVIAGIRNLECCQP